MKDKLIEEIKDIIAQSKGWISLEIEYAKLTVAEKFTVFMGALIVGAVSLLFGMVVLLILAMAIAEAFKLIIEPVYAYLATAGCIIVLLVLFSLFRKPLLLNPIAKFITRLIIEKKD